MRGPAEAGPRRLAHAGGGLVALAFVASVSACAIGPAPSRTEAASTTEALATATAFTVMPSQTPYTGERPELPPDFPVPPNAVELPLPADRAVIARWQAPPVPRPYDFYHEALPAAGYPITLSGAGGAAAIIRFEVEPGVIWQINLGGDLETVDITLRLPHP